ncbi:hypothetical protein NQZ68_008314 [Dissostichus eleginoides]|nr:hypothetical protein NQZ68_008314 [Dissostichus eleginoides]
MWPSSWESKSHLLGHGSLSSSLYIAVNQGLPGQFGATNRSLWLPWYALSLHGRNAIRHRLDTLTFLDL